MKYFSLSFRNLSVSSRNLAVIISQILIGSRIHNWSSVYH
jgi:hypothetical protein